MNIAIIKAGGVGSRMGAQIPKQFVLVDGKPVIIHTLEAFDSHPNIDEIVVSCLGGWEDILRTYAEKFGITKLKTIVAGGETSLKSIRNGLEPLRGYDKNDVVLVHDANRPLVSEEIISGVMAQSARYGMAVAAIPCTDEVAIVDLEDPETARRFANRKELVRIQTPDAYKLGTLLEIFDNATEEQLTTIGATNVLAVAMGYEMHLAMGSEVNIRLTTQEDIVLFEALLIAQSQRRAR